jgi:hypothetical protein
MVRLRGLELWNPRAGADTRIVSPKEARVRGWKFKDWGDELLVVVRLDQARPEDFGALHLPGGVINPDSLRMQLFQFLSQKELIMSVLRWALIMFLVSSGGALWLYGCGGGKCPCCTRLIPCLSSHLSGSACDRSNRLVCTIRLFKRLKLGMELSELPYR